MKNDTTLVRSESSDPDEIATLDDIADEESAPWTSGWNVARLKYLLVWLAGYLRQPVNEVAFWFQRIEDREGCLTVTWRHKSFMTAWRLEAVARAWEEVGNEPDNIEHQTASDCD